MYRDDLGLIVQRDGDGGDTLQRTGFYYLPGLIANNEESILHYDAELSTLWGAEGPTRHIKQWSNQSEVSRDQLTPNIAALGFSGSSAKVEFLLIRLIKNFFRYPNGTDFASPEHIGIFLRAILCAKDRGFNWKAALFYPLLLLGDLFMILGVIIRCYQAKDPDNVGDDLNTLVSVVQAQHTCGTPLSWLARKLYVKFRPQPFIGLDGPMSTNNVFLALVWYFRKESGGNPEIALAWKDICDNL